MWSGLRTRLSDCKNAIGGKSACHWEQNATPIRTPDLSGCVASFHLLIKLRILDWHLIRMFFSMSIFTPLRALPCPCRRIGPLPLGKRGGEKMSLTFSFLIPFPPCPSRGFISSGVRNDRSSSLSEVQEKKHLHELLPSLHDLSMRWRLVA